MNKKTKETLRITIWATLVLGGTALGAALLFQNPEETMELLLIVRWIPISIGAVSLLAATGLLIQALIRLKTESADGQGEGWTIIGAFYLGVFGILCTGIPLLWSWRH